MDDGITCAHLILPRPRPGDVAGDRDGSRINGQGLGPRGTDEDSDIMSFKPQASNERPSDESGSSGDEDAHVTGSFS
jgi:hypothetical protein